MLSGYPSDLFDYLVSGFSHGFRVGYLGCISPGRDRNNQSASQNESSVSKAILTELKRGHTCGPFVDPPFNPFHCSPLGAAPKKDGSSRIILDLSAPLGSSVNDGIPYEFFTVKYSSFDDAVSLVRCFGPGCFMAKVDIKHAFRLCPVHPSDWPLLGYKWLGKYYFDLKLPFGSRSSPFIFNAFADALLWIIINKFGVTGIVHYLDDFFICASTRTECQRAVDTVLHVFSLLGVPVALDKLEGPSQVITFLGIEIDSIHSIIRLPHEKLMSLSQSIESWVSLKKCRKVELLSLIGSLSFACKVIKPGRIFLRRLIDLSTSVSRLHHHIDLNTLVRSDFHMWRSLLSFWNGSSIIQSSPVSSDCLCLFTDASFLGLGGYFRGSWFSSSWPDNQLPHNIATLELFAVYVAITIWGTELCNKQIIIHSDNEAIVQAFNFGSSRNKQLMSLIRAIFFSSVRFNISVTLKHVPGSSNLYADLLSRLQVSKFKDVCPDAHPSPTTVPTSVWQTFTDL